MSKAWRAIVGLDAGRTTARWGAITGYVVLGFFVLIVSHIAVGKLGGSSFLVALVGIFFASAYTIVSFRYISIPFYVWIASVGGFRYLWSIQTPILPDLYLDRMTMIWLAMVFLVKFVALRRPLRAPYYLEIALVAHALYLLAQLYFFKIDAMNAWTMSVLIPYTAFVMAKNIVNTKQQIRATLWILWGLSTYYNVTAIAEKFDIAWLVWPKYILAEDAEFVGRSVGPFLQAPLFGTVIGMLLPVHLYFLATVRRSWIKSVLTINLLLGLAGLYFTYTRGSWLAGVAALAATAVLNRKAYARYFVPVAVAAPLVAVFFLGIAQDKFLKERVANEDTIGSRIGTAVTVLRVWRDHPILGVGFYGYRKVRDEYIQPVEIPGLPTITFQQFRKNAIHDIYLGPLAETGIVGTGLQVFIYAFILRVFWRKYQLRVLGDEFALMVIPVFGGLTVGYLIGGLAIDYRFFSVVGMLFLLCAGIVDGYKIGAQSDVRPSDA